MRESVHPSSTATSSFQTISRPWPDGERFSSRTVPAFTELRIVRSFVGISIRLKVRCWILSWMQYSGLGGWKPQRSHAILVPRYSSSPFHFQISAVPVSAVVAAAANHQNASRLFIEAAALLIQERTCHQTRWKKRIINLFITHRF